MQNRDLIIEHLEDIGRVLVGQSGELAEIKGTLGRLSDGFSVLSKRVADVDLRLEQIDARLACTELRLR